jgi:Tfp pilus assembly protein PilN
MIERIEINLLPAEYRIRKRSLRIPRTIIYPAVVILALAVAAGIATIHMNNKEADLAADIERINKEIQANRHLQADINRIREEKRVTQQKIEALEQISVDREKWVRLLEMLSGNLPAYSWLISVREEAGPPARLAIEARTFSFPEVAHYMSRLEAHDLISEVQLSGIEQVQWQDRRAYKFTINCLLAATAAPIPEAESDEAAAAARGRGRGRR